MTIILAVFTVVLYLFLLSVRRAIILPVYRSKSRFFVFVSLAILLGMLALTQPLTLDQRIRFGCLALLVLSFLLDKTGFTEEELILLSLDLKGIPLDEIERVVLFQDEDTGLVKLNFFRNDRRGPLLKFDRSIEEIVIFLSTHLKKGTRLEVVTKK